MSLPSLLKFVYNHGSGQVITRGKKIFFARGVSLLDVDHHLEQVRFRVRNDVYNNFYTVTVAKFLHPEQLSVRCQCPYNLGEICRHEVAAVFHLNDLVQSGFFNNNALITYNQQHTVVRMRDINPQMVRLFSSEAIMEQAIPAAAAGNCRILLSKNERVKAEVPDGDEVFEVTLVQNEDRYFDTSCSCTETAYPICLHKAILFLQLHQQHGAQYFRSLQNWDDQKNKLLRQYGYSLNDDLEGKFDFIYDNGKPFLRILDPEIRKVGAPPVTTAAVTEVDVQPEPVADNRALGLVINTGAKRYPHCDIQLITGELGDEDRLIGTVEKIDLQKYINTDVLQPEEQEWINIARKTTAEEIVRYLRKNLPFGDFIGDPDTVLQDKLQPELFQPVWEYLLPKYRSLLQRSSGNPRCYLHQKGTLTTASLTNIRCADTAVRLLLDVRKEKDHYITSRNWEIGGVHVDAGDVTVINAALLRHDNTLYSLSQVTELTIADAFIPDNRIVIPADQWHSFLEEQLIPWRKHVSIHFADELIAASGSMTPAFRLYLQEQGDLFLLKPAFVYDGVEARLGEGMQIVKAAGDRVAVIDRDTIAEHEYCTMLKGLHEQMLFSMRDKHFYLPAKEVLSKNWYFAFTEKMQEWNVSMYGHDNLKALRINSHKPETRINISSNIDWFETSVQLSFGNQSVSIAEVKKALSRKENFVKLPDGSIGLLPEDMMQKFTLLTKMGEIKDNKLHIKKIHFSILDELLSEVNEEQLQQELEEKKHQLERIIDNDYSQLRAPDTLRATLRPYQQAGFQWMMFLKEAGWGGILADDMGLGKTVQTLSWLAYYKEQHPEAKFLVVCPTTLTYNWEKEIAKFTPDLKALIHHGPKRAASVTAFAPYDVIITSYGTIRSDIKMLGEFCFDYVVLDESQAIKNPKSLATKAASLLNARYRLALSGTPIQNNTFDLYAQMNFLNPGMLGSRDFFMNEFAVPIDKFQEPEAKDQLRKLIYPFLLRRTKDQVARDLPEKTETVLYCEMGKEQRKIYEAYRSNYQSKILGMIDEQGLQRSQFHILQGLTRLRQICDSPAIINEEEKFGNFSVKLDELTRELEENTGEHKALVFSQFLGMLSLIRDALKAKDIPFVYFDGSSTNAEREKAIEAFQNNPDCKVFLISLKAGGVGLNLTAADYVYIVDPWWNPAVEQQAIDRTHRIGQTKSVFAYRFICKDTIEEKMLVLQERKRTLASDLISDDSTILKRLTREDIAFLFS